MNHRQDGSSECVGNQRGDYFGFVILQLASVCSFAAERNIINKICY